MPGCDKSLLQYPISPELIDMMAVYFAAKPREISFINTISDIHQIEVNQLRLCSGFDWRTGMFERSMAQTPKEQHIRDRDLEKAKCSMFTIARAKDVYGPQVVIPNKDNSLQDPVGFPWQPPATFDASRYMTIETARQRLIEFQTNQRRQTAQLQDQLIQGLGAIMINDTAMSQPQVPGSPDSVLQSSPQPQWQVSILQSGRSLRRSSRNLNSTISYVESNSYSPGAAPGEEEPDWSEDEDFIESD